jgi:hypothetical protein
VITSFLIYGIAIPLSVTIISLAALHTLRLHDGARSISGGVGGLTALVFAFGMPGIPPAEFAHSLILISSVIILGAVVATKYEFTTERMDRILFSLALLLPFAAIAWQMNANGLSWVDKFTDTGLWLTVSACFLLGTLGWTMTSSRETRRAAGWTLSLALMATGITLLVTNSARLGQVLVGCSLSILITRLIAKTDGAEQRLLAVGLSFLVGLIVYAQAFVELPATVAATLLVIPMIAIGAREDDQRRHQIAAVVLACCLAGASVGIAVDAQEAQPSIEEYEDYE